MNIHSLISTEYEQLPAATPVSKLVGVLTDPAVTGVVVTTEEEYAGVVTRRQLTASQYQPSRTIGSLVWHVPRVEPTANVRDVARLMLDSDSRLLPVFEGGTLRGVVTADDILEAVTPFLDVATVKEVYSDDLVTVSPDDTFGKTIHVLREHRFTHLPVVEDDTAVGILSLYDVTDVATRATRKSQGGDAGGPGVQSASAGGSQGGHGAREGELDRVLDLPVRDVMVSPVETIAPEATLDTAVERMFDASCSSLVVTDDGSPFGIVTKSDLLAALTWETEGSRAVQVYGMDLLDDLNYSDVVETVEALTNHGGDMNVIDAKLHLQELDETRRGVPLLRARLRLATDDGQFIATGEGYGANHALNEARDVMERRIRDARTAGKSKKHPDADYWEKRFGWWLEE